MKLADLFSLLLLHFCIQIYSTFIMLLKVMTNMQKASVFECFFVGAGLAIGGNKACEPVIRDAD